MAQQLDYPLAESLAAYRRAIEALPAGEAALVLYSRLFLIPGSAHPHINTGAYFDGSINGDTVRKLAECYGACGLQKDASLADLPDHAAVQLEFAAWLFAVEASRAAGDAAAATPISAQDFITAFVARGAPLLRQDLEQAGARFGLTDNPWLHLARILETVAAREAAPPSAVAPQSAPSEIERLRRQYAGRMPDADELARLRATLEEHGLSGAHVSVPLDARDAADGLTPLDPPRPPRHALPIE